MVKTREDFFRDTYVRYLGYANEVCQAFSLVLPDSVVRAAYGVTFCYIFADTFDKSLNSFRRDGMFKAITTAGDVLIWQTLASVIIPRFAINRICYFTHYTLRTRAKSMPVSNRVFITIAVGLASIPFIIGPIDTAVTVLMNNTYRRIF